MAKKQAGTPAEDKPAAGAPEQDKGAEKRPREPRGKGKPDAPVAAAAPAPPGDGAAPPAAQAPAGPEVKRKGKKPGKPPRRGKKLQSHLKNIRQKVEKEGAVPLKRAVQLLQQVKRAKFHETVEVHMSLGIDPQQSDQMIRGSVPLPHGVGKVVRVLV